MDWIVSQSAVLTVIIPLASAFLIFAVGLWKKEVCHPLALVAISLSLLSSIVTLLTVLRTGPIQYHLGNWDPPWGIEYVVDHLSAFLLVIITSMSLLSAIYAKKTVEAELPGKTVYFYTCFLLLITGLLGMVSTGDMFNLYVFIELTALTCYALISAGEKKAPFASFRYVLMGTIGACFYLIGVGYLYLITGSLNMADLRVLLPPLYNSKAVQAAFIFCIIGFGTKMALFPLHSWQPDAYTYAPSAVSIIISTAMAKATIYALIRVIFSVFTVDFIAGFELIFELICWIAAAGMIFGSIYAIRQSNLKKMLAYSSVANVGYIMLGVGLSTSTSLGLTPVLMHILNHALMKGAMFMVACAFIYKAGLRDIKDFTGLGRKMPVTSFAFILSALAMIGMPPGVGFITKWYLILAALEAGKFIFVAVIFFSTLLMIVYFWRVVEIMYIRADEGPPGKVQASEIPFSMLAPESILAFLCFGVGVAWISGIFSPVLDAVNSGFGLGMVP